MKYSHILFFVLLLSNFMGIAQHKIYTTDEKLKVRGTYNTLSLESGHIAEDSRQKELFASATVISTIGPALVQSGIGFIQNKAKRRASLATASFITNPISLNFHDNGIYRT